MRQLVFALLLPLLFCVCVAGCAQSAKISRVGDGRYLDLPGAVFKADGITLMVSGITVTDQIKLENDRYQSGVRLSVSLSARTSIPSSKCAFSNDAYFDEIIDDRGINLISRSVRGTRNKTAERGAEWRNSSGSNTGHRYFINIDGLRRVPKRIERVSGEFGANLVRRTEELVIGIDPDTGEGAGQLSDGSTIKCSIEPYNSTKHSLTSFRGKRDQAGFMSVEVRNSGVELPLDPIRFVPKYQGVRVEGAGSIVNPGSNSRVKWLDDGYRIYRGLTNIYSDEGELLVDQAELTFVTSAELRMVPFELGPFDMMAGD